MKDAIIRAEALRFSYTSAEGVAPVVLDGVDLSIQEGTFVAVLGHNGSGKSTLAKHMNAILLPSGGKVYVDGIDTVDEDRLLDIRRTVGMVFQNPDNQIVANVVEEDVAFAPENLGVASEEIRRRLRTIRDLNRKKGVTVVLITHHMDEAAQADRLVVMTKGRVIADGPPRQVFQDVEGLRSVGLTVPDTTQLLWELRQEGLDVPLDALSDEECAQALCQLLNAASKKGSQP